MYIDASTSVKLELNWKHFQRTTKFIKTDMSTNDKQITQSDFAYSKPSINNSCPYSIRHVMNITHLYNSNSKPGVQIPTHYIYNAINTPTNPSAATAPPTGGTFPPAAALTPLTPVSAGNRSVEVARYSLWLATAAALYPVADTVQVVDACDQVSTVPLGGADTVPAMLCRVEVPFVGKSPGL